MAANMPTPSGPGLRRLSELDEYEIEAGYPDIRGWGLVDTDGREIGSVTDLLIDTRRGEPVSVMVHRKDRNWFMELFSEEENGRLPLSAISLDEPNQVVRVTEPIDRLLEGRVTGTGATAAHGAATTAAETSGAETARRTTGEGERTMDIIEERLDVEKARRKAGEVRVGKTVESETVRREVPVEREEVSVERERLDRPIPASEAAAHMAAREGEIVVPIYREEIEVTKRPVVAERLRIRKRMVQGTEDVTGEVRRERAVVEGPERPTTPEGGQPGGGRRRRA